MVGQKHIHNKGIVLREYQPPPKEKKKLRVFFVNNIASLHHTKLTLDQGQMSWHQMKANSPCLIFYMSVIQIESLSLVVFEIFAKMAFLTFDLGPRSKVMTPDESLYDFLYISLIQMKSLSVIVFVIFAKIKISTFDLGGEHCTIHSLYLHSLYTKHRAVTITTCRYGYNHFVQLTNLLSTLII